MGERLLKPRDDPVLSLSAWANGAWELCGTTERHTDSAVVRDGDYEEQDALECSVCSKLEMEAPTETEFSQASI